MVDQGDRAAALGVSLLRESLGTGRRARPGAARPPRHAHAALYWAEGSKARNTVKLTNSDPELVAYFLQFLREHFGVSDSRVRLACNLFADHAERRREIEDFWLSRLQLGRDSLRASTVNTFSKYSQKKRANKLPYGTAALIVHSTQIAQTIYGSIQELSGFARTDWLG